MFQMRADRTSMSCEYDNGISSALLCDDEEGRKRMRELLVKVDGLLQDGRVRIHLLPDSLGIHVLDGPRKKSVVQCEKLEDGRLRWGAERMSESSVIAAAGYLSMLAHYLDNEIQPQRAESHEGT
jgi:hypothetical protein